MALSLNSPENPWKHALQDLDDTTMETATQAYQTWFRSMMAMNAEATRFFTRRLQQDAQLPMTIIQCRSPQDVVQKQMEFLKTMADDYSGQAEKMGEIMSEGFHAIDRPATLSWPVPEKAQIVKKRDTA